MLGIYYEAQMRSLGVICGAEEEHGESRKGKSRYFIQIIEESIQVITSYSYIAMRT